MLESATESIINSHRNDQRNTSYCKRIVIRVILSNPPSLLGIVHHCDSRSRSKQGTDVDGHIENTESRVTLGSIFGVIIQITNHNLQITFKQSGSAADHQQSGKHGNHTHSSGSHRKRQKHISGKHGNDTDGNHLSITELIGKNTSNKREEINQSQENRINISSYSMRPTEVSLQKQNENSKHSVVTETLACVGQGQRIKSFRLSFKHKLMVLISLKLSLRSQR